MIHIITFLAILNAILVCGSPDCDACLENECFTKSKLFDGMPVTGLLAIDREKNLLYFQYSIDEDLAVQTQLDLTTMEKKALPVTGPAISRAVDQESHDLYLTGNQVLYKFNPDNQFLSIKEMNETIYYLQYHKNKLYYTMYTLGMAVDVYDENDVYWKGIYVYDNKQVTSIAALRKLRIDQFVIDKNDDIYFTRDLQVYRLENGSSMPQLFLPVEVDTKYSYRLTLDKNGEVYLTRLFSGNLYKVDYDNKVDVALVGTFGNGRPSQALFDNSSNVIYQDVETGEILKLTRNAGSCNTLKTGRAPNEAWDIEIDVLIPLAIK